MRVSLKNRIRNSNIFIVLRPHTSHATKKLKIIYLGKSSQLPINNLYIFILHKNKFSLNSYTKKTFYV